MNDVIFGEENRLERLTISLACRTDLAQLLTERCSRLFDRQLRELIVDTVGCVHQRYSLPSEIPCIRVDLGEMSLLQFEAEFCARFADRFERCLESYGATNFEPERSDTVAGSTALVVAASENADNTVLFTRYLQHGYWSQPEAWLRNEGADSWLMAQNKAAPVLWRALIARACLFPLARRRLLQLLTPDTLRQCLVITGPITPHTLLLGALHYFQRNPQQTSSLPQVETEVLVVPVTGNEELLTSIFSTTVPPALASWLQALWHHRPLRTWLKSHLPSHQMESVPQPWADSGAVGHDRERTPAQEAPVRTPKLASAPVREATSVATQPPFSLPTQVVPLNLPTMPVTNAGLVLLWPLLPDLFTRLRLWDKDHFITPQAQINAACWLDSLIWADDCSREWRMTFTKWLCGLPLDCEIEWQAPDDDATGKLQDWLAALSRQLPGWRSLGPQDIRTLFLQRPGVLERIDASLKLRVQREPFDILLNDWPWPLDSLMLPWLEYPLSVEWL